MEISPVPDKCLKGTGPAPNAEPKSLSFLSNRTETDLYSAVIVTDRRDKIIADSN